MRNGEWGPDIRAGECPRRGELDRPGSTRLRRFRSRLRSDDGDSVRKVPERAEEKTPLSLASPASLSVGGNPRRLDWDVPKTAAALLCERGVGHSNGLFDPVDTATEGDRPSEDCGGGKRSGELRMDMVKADTAGAGGTAWGSGIGFGLGLGAAAGDMVPISGTSSSAELESLN